VTPNSTSGRSPPKLPSDIACWFIDSNYSGDAFYVRHAYFTGGASDPYAALKKALRAEINTEAWEALKVFAI
jgi:adenine-specific DNA-methyltransferase